MGGIKENIASIREKINAACKRAKRDPREVTLLAATKDVPEKLIEEAIEAGICTIGENRVREAEDKLELKEKHPCVSWHFIGHLQTNKVKRALGIFDIMESIDSEHLALELSKAAREAGKEVKVLVEVNVSGQRQKFGVSEDEAASLLKHMSGLGNLKVLGLMTVPPYSPDPELSRPYFGKLKVLRERLDELKLPNVDLRLLSMGMTGDFEVAVEEGANIVRVGMGIFGIEHGK